MLMFHYSIFLPHNHHCINYSSHNKTQSTSVILGKVKGGNLDAWNRKTVDPVENEHGGGSQRWFILSPYGASRILFPPLLSNDWPPIYLSPYVSFFLSKHQCDLALFSFLVNSSSEKYWWTTSLPSHQYFSEGVIDSQDLLHLHSLF